MADVRTPVASGALVDVVVDEETEPIKNVVHQKQLKLEMSSES